MSRDIVGCWPKPGPWRNNVTIAAAVYVVIARRLGVALITGDIQLARAPGIDIEERQVVRDAHDGHEPLSARAAWLQTIEWKRKSAALKAGSCIVADPGTRRSLPLSRSATSKRKRGLGLPNGDEADTKAGRRGLPLRPDR